MSQVPPLLVSVVTWWYWISSLRYWLVLGGTGSEQGSSGCQCDMLSENIWFTWCKPSNSSIFGEGKSDYGQTHTQTHRHTDRQNFLSKTRPLLWKGSSKKYHEKLTVRWGWGGSMLAVSLTVRSASCTQYYHPWTLHQTKNCLLLLICQDFVLVSTVSVF